MSIEIQKQIKDNSRSVSEYFKDLVTWEEEQEKGETRRDAMKKGIRPNTVQKPLPAPRGSEQTDETGSRSEESIARDKLKMPQYYNDWEHYDAEEEADKLDLKEEDALRRKKKERQAEKDQILDEMAWTGDGDRVRTSKARPRVKVSVRVKGRPPAPIDLAKPKKEEANNYFAQGRYKEAMIAYSVALDYLEKYEPPGERSEEAAGENGDSQTQKEDGAGQETEALELKVVLLANRAQALIKIEEWREAIEDCCEALRFDPTHHKAILRRGFALAKQKRWAAAAKDLESAVAKDPQDRKAAAELAMARRNLAEQAKEVRAHAKTIVCDTTRESTMPTRTLKVGVRRPGGAVETAKAAGASAASAASTAFQPQPRGARGEARAPVDLDDDAPPAVASAGSAAAAPRVKQPYVPRSVRIRGRQPVPEAGSAAPQQPAASSSAPDAAPAINFYTFESQWMRQRNKPKDRAALLRRMGAANLPALFRESLDAELVGSIISVLSAELSADSEGAVAFASSVMGSLSRTQRFEASLEALSAEERSSCEDVFLALERQPASCSEDVTALRRAFEPPAPLPQHAEDEEEYDEDDVPMESEVPAQAPAAAEAPPAMAVASSNIMLPEAATGVVEFSLDGCD